ncbi:MAG: putative S-layer protein [Nanoarchaeota archaeon]|nr:putative S-layer protein [Nanoarchaeota archaeon]
MRVQKYVFAILFALFLVTIVSAASVPINVVAPSSVNTGQTFDVRFAINNTEATSINNLTLSYADSKSDPFASLISASSGSRTFTITTADSSSSVTYSALLDEFAVQNGTVSQEITLTFRANANALFKTHSETISLQAKNPAGNTVAVDSVGLNINVNQVSQIALVKLRDLTANQSGIINVTNLGNAGLSTVTLTAEGSIPVTFSDNNFGLNVKGSRSVQVTATSTSNLKFGSNPINIIASGSNGVSSQLQLDLVKTFCRSGEVGRNLSIQSVEIDTDADEEDEWKPLTKVVIEADVENIGTDKISNVYVEFGLFDSNGKNVADDLDFESADAEVVKIGSIDDADEEKATFEFIVPADFKEGSYRIALKAYSKSSSLGEDRLCTASSSDLAEAFYEEVSVIKEDDEDKLIIFDEVSMSPTEAICGSRIVVNFDMINVGEDEQDQVKVSLVNPELGLSVSQEIREDLGSGDSESLSFTFNIPDRATSKTYTLRLGAEYDYRSGRYRESTSDPYEISLRVTCANAPGGNGQSNVLITASLAQDSQAKAGEEMTINARVTNTGLNSSNFIIGVRNEDSWATLESISERVVLLQPGESREIRIVLDVDEDASGENTFTIDALSEGRTESRDVVIDIAGTKSAGGSSLFGSLKNNSLLWVIGLVNLVLIILIIIVAVRLSRR